MTPERYGIYLAALDPTVGREIAKTRPVVVVSLDVLNRVLDTVVVCPLTTSLHPGWRSRLPVKCAGKPAEIAVDQIRTVSKDRRSHFIAGCGICGNARRAARGSGSEHHLILKELFHKIGYWSQSPGIFVPV